MSVSRAMSPKIRVSLGEKSQSSPDGFDYIVRMNSYL